MKRSPVLWILAICLIVGMVSCSRGGRVLSRSRMVDIYVDMFLADQWLGDNYQARRTADTTLFYEPIFRSHGCSFKDFDKSVSYYISDPEKYSKMMKTVSDRIKKEAGKLQEILTAIENFKEPDSYSPFEFRSDTLYWLDSLVIWVRPDSVSACPDSLCVADSLCRVDSLAVRDSLAIVDSLKIESTL